MSHYKAIDVAAYIIHKANTDHNYNANDLTPLKLQKILYFAQGWYLANYGEPLFDDRICAWEYGPVVDSVYHRYKNHPVTQIKDDEAIGDRSAITDSNAKTLLDEVWDRYKGYNAFELVGRTHVTRPWEVAYNDPVNDEIDIEDMRDYFESRM